MVIMHKCSRCTVISTELLAAVGMMMLSVGSELTLTRQANIVVSTSLSSGLMERVEVKVDWLPDWVVPEMLVILGDDDRSIPIGVPQVKFTITLMSTTLVRVMVQMRSRAVPATMVMFGLTGSTTTVGGGTRGRESSCEQKILSLHNSTVASHTDGRRQV